MTHYFQNGSASEQSKRHNKPGQLYIVATPIGNLLDFSPRAIETLQQVNVIAAEDTRHSGQLLKHFDINTRTIAMHEHNERQSTDRLIQRLLDGQSIALISDAGTPLVSDPGYFLVRNAHQAGVKVVPVPGPSAMIAALSAAGLATDRFSFEGFVPAKSGPRRKYYAERNKEPRTMVFYETPHRIVDSLSDLCQTLGEERVVVLARELTKTFETIKKDTAEKLLHWVKADPNQQKGEIVLVVEGYTKQEEHSLNEQTEHILKTLLEELTLKQAVKLTVNITGEKKKKIYDFALSLQQE
jgi:16S rRNA (cytidine1402-2'-O)-methyltransferase